MTGFCEGSPSKLKQFTKSLRKFSIIHQNSHRWKEGLFRTNSKIIFEREGKGRKGVVGKMRLAVS